MLSVVVVGAGISGLTFSIALTRHQNARVTILERVPALKKACSPSSKSTSARFISQVQVASESDGKAQFGNGLQIPCNAAHAMRCLGLLDKLLAQSNGIAKSLKSLAYSDGKELLERDLARYAELYDAPWLFVHRADYMRILLNEATRLGVLVEPGCEVRSVDFAVPSVTLANGQVYTADIIVGADGVHSTMRTLMHPSIHALSTGEYAFRALFTHSKLATPALKELASNADISRIWLGPNCNVVLYPLRNGTVFNLVIPIVDTTFNTSFPEEDLLNSIKHYLRDWDPVVHELLKQTDKIVRFPLYQVETLPFWSKGKVTLMGDAAHAMHPYLAQGAATAVEDGFILGSLLGLWAERSQNADSTPPAQQLRILLESYEKLQHERTTRIASNSRLTGILEHLPDGPEQQARDAEFASFDPERTVSGMPWIDARWNGELLGRKVDQVTEREFRRLIDEGEL